MSSMSLIFIWLDKRLGYLPGGNEKLKEKFRKILSPIKQFDKPTNCFDFIKDSLKDKNVIFLTTNIFAEEDFLQTIACLSNVLYLYIYDTSNKQYHFNQQILNNKLGEQRIIQFDEHLYEQLIKDLIFLYQNKAIQLQKIRQTKEAKQLFQYAYQLIDTIDEKDQDFQQIQQDLSQQIDTIK